MKFNKELRFYWAESVKAAPFDVEKVLKILEFGSSRGNGLHQMAFCGFQHKFEVTGMFPRNKFSSKSGKIQILRWISTKTFCNKRQKKVLKINLSLQNLLYQLHTD